MEKLEKIFSINFIRIFIGIVINLYFAYFLAKNFNLILSSIYYVISKIDFISFLKFFVVFVIEFEFQTIRFILLSNKKINIKNLLRFSYFYFLSLFVSFIIPIRALGELARANKLSFLLKDYFLSIKLIIIERFLDIFILFSLFAISFLATNLFKSFPDLIFLLLLFSLIFLFLFLNIFDKTVFKVIEIFENILYRKILNRLIKKGDFSGYINFNLNSLKLPILLTFIIWIIDSIRNYLIFKYFNYSGSFSYVVFVITLTYLSLIFSFLPGGLIVCEGIMIKLLSKVMDYKDSISSTLVGRFFSFWIVIIIGLFLYLSFVVYSYYGRRKLSKTTRELSR